MVDAEDFVSRVKPALEAQDWDALMTTLNTYWTTDQIIGLLSHKSCDARKIAALAVGLIGQSRCLPELSARLRDSDRMVCDMAEHAMWQIWFRGGSSVANAELARGAEALNQQQIDQAMAHLNKAIALSPDFAEAYNQRAIAHYMAERFEESVHDCERVIQLMPLHFGAWCGLGHSYLAMGDVEEALRAYRKALKLNPHLECVAELVQELAEQSN
ncbi:MAG: tetratricopeptide repeat protein [Tepidisphaeraceae bacterium]